MRIVFIAFWIVLLFAQWTAASDYQQLLIDSAIKQNLADSPHWHALLYYKKHGLSRRLESEVDDAKFFLSKNGKTKPEDELSAYIAGLFSTELSDDNPQCRFPARFYWLSQVLSIDRTRLPQPHCLSFEAWFARANVGGATIVFPAAYLDSPSSMFGHTLLRLDQRDQNESNRILAYTVNYAANKKPEDSELAFVYRGLVGGYPGDTTILPYYMKLKEYNDIESRDIWEYRLNLTQEETDQLVRHIWEIQQVNFDYFFFTENCSYRVLGMLDVVRPQARMLEQFHLFAIPIDTVRAAKHFNYVVKTDYRPSIITRLNYQLSQLNTEQQTLVYDLVQLHANNLEILDQQEDKEKNTVLEIAYQYSRVVPVETNQAAKTSYRLLKARKDSDEKSILKAVPTPDKSDDEGHLSSRLSLSMGQRDETDYLQWQLRPAYHDLTDPGQGYPFGAELKFLEMTLRHYLHHYDNEQNQLEEITMIGIKSIKPRNRFFKPLSWEVAVGARRMLSDDSRDGGRDLVPQLQGSLGPAYRFGDTLFYGLLGGEAQLSSKLVRGHDIRGRLQSGMLWRNEDTQIQIDYFASDSVVNGASAEQKLSYHQLVNIAAQQAVDIQLNRYRQQSRYFSEFIAGWIYYF